MPVEDARVDAGQGVVAAAFAQLGDVGAGGEDALGSGFRVGRGAGKHQDLRCALKVGAHRVQLVDHLLVDGVVDLGAVKLHQQPSAGSVTFRVAKPVVSNCSATPRLPP